MTTGAAAAASPRRAGAQARRATSARCRPSTSSLGLAEALPSGLYSGEGIERYVRTILSDPDRTDDFRLLSNELYLAATDLDTCERIVFGRRGLGRRADLDRGRAPRARCRWSTSRSRSRTAS